MDDLKLSIEKCQSLARILATVRDLRARQHLVELMLHWLKPHVPPEFKALEFAALVEEAATRRQQMFEDHLPKDDAVREG